jgi:phosphate transport system substrate-binding protein
MGSAGPIASLLAKEFSQQVPDASVTIVDPPLGSGGAIQAMAKGSIGMAILGRTLNPDEADVFGRRFLLATTPFVLVSSDGQRPTGFTLDELADVYEGRSQTWDQGEPIRLVLRTPGESDTRQLMLMSPAMARAVVLARQRPGMVTAWDDLQTLELLTHTPGSLGTTSLGLLKVTGTRLVVFPVNGVVPSVAAMEDGSYPWHKSLIVMLPSQASPVAEQFASFLRSDRAKDLLRQYGYQPRQ